MMLGSCASKLSCVECHDPHASDATAKLRALDAAGKDALCTKCHDRYVNPAALREHAHHDPAGEGGRCSPATCRRRTSRSTGRSRATTGSARPAILNASSSIGRWIGALCHAEQERRGLSSPRPRRWWKRPYDRDALRKLYGDLDANVLLATAERGKPHEQAVAFFLLGEARSRPAIPILAAQLTNPYPLVRGYAKRALDTIAGSPIPIDIDGEDTSSRRRRARGSRPRSEPTHGDSLSEASRSATASSLAVGRVRGSCDIARSRSDATPGGNVGHIVRNGTWGWKRTSVHLRLHRCLLERTLSRQHLEGDDPQAEDVRRARRVLGPRRQALAPCTAASRR